MDNYPSSLSSSRLSSSRVELLDSSSPHQEEEIQPDFRVMRESEHMFDKVVTPSDVGKLNRLVIPKQHAEKYFPLDSSSSSSHDDADKIKGGLLLNFEDYQTGKLWRFRYSYWNSSQSYVMTKGWSRFVKEKKLNPGDMVSFLRSSGGGSHNNFFIDWRRRMRRPDNYNVPFSPPPPFDLLRSHHPHLLRPPPPIYWGHSTPNLLNVRRSMLFPYAPHPHCNIINRSTLNYCPPSSSSSSSSYVDYLQTVMRREVHREDGRVILEPVPLVQGNGGGAAGKRLRLFGVNMDCPNV